MTNWKRAILILCAGSIEGKFNFHSFIYQNPGLVPVATKNTLSYILDFYSSGDMVIYIAINSHEKEIFIRETLYYRNINFIFIEKTSGVVHTLEQSLVFIKENDITINLGTTIPTVDVNLNSCLFDVNKTVGPYSGIINTKNSFTFISKTNFSNQPMHAFTWVFRMIKSNLFLALDGITCYTDLWLLIQLLLGKYLDISYSSWIDTGHDINYSDARKLLISSRFFNSMHIDNNTGIITKKSSNLQKLGQEIDYIFMLPKELSCFFPRIFDFDKNTGEMSMEYYPYPTLSEYQLYWSLDSLRWARIFESIRFVLLDFRKYKFSIWKNAFSDFFIGKTFQRINIFLNSLNQDDAILSSDFFTINWEICSNIFKIKRDIEIKVLSFYTESSFAIMHGDFCFNNILFDYYTNTIKLIDPRGSFWENCTGIYGDVRYDLSKLAHSVVGYYDYIVNNLFSFSEESNIITYQFPIRDNQKIIEKLIFDLFADLKENKNEILFIVGLLFLSMCPLHAENKIRQRLMYFHGLYYVNRYLSD